MATIADIDVSRADIKNTTTGLVEYSTGISLEDTIEKLRDVLAERGVPVVDGDSDLATIEATEAILAYVKNGGFYYYDSADLVPGEGIQSTDGGFWNKDHSLTLDQLITGTPANGDVPTWNASNSRYEPGVPTVTALGWSNITGKPTNIDSIAATDVLIKLFDGLTKSIGATDTGDGNIALTPNGSSVTTMTNSVLVATNDIPYLTEINDSIIITDATSFRPGTTPLTINNCRIIGNPGDLSQFVSSNVLADMTIIGESGTIIFIGEFESVNIPANITLGSVLPVVGTPPHTITLDADVIASEDVDVTGDVTIAGTLDVDDNVSITGGSDLSVSGDLTVSGTATANAVAAQSATLTGGNLTVTVGSTSLQATTIAGNLTISGLNATLGGSSTTTNINGTNIFSPNTPVYASLAAATSALSPGQWFINSGNDNAISRV